MEWQPIETAPTPKEGEEYVYVLIWETALLRPIVGRFHPRYGWNDETGEYDYQPTHWMSLPNPPDICPPKFALRDRAIAGVAARLRYVADSVAPDEVPGELHALARKLEDLVL